MNKSKSLKKTRLHCPVCDSADIYTVAGGYTGNLYKCKKCGYQGALVIEHEDSLDDDFEKALDHSKSPDNTEKQVNVLHTKAGQILAALLILLFATAVIMISKI